MLTTVPTVSHLEELLLNDYITFDLCLIVNQSNALSPEFYMRSHFCSKRGLEVWVQEVKILSNSPVRLLCAQLNLIFVAQSDTYDISSNKVFTLVPLHARRLLK